nr:MAG TPA: hypothetical protein [Caudoviricetes sp.]
MNATRLLERVRCGKSGTSFYFYLSLVFVTGLFCLEEYI